MDDVRRLGGVDILHKGADAALIAVGVGVGDFPVLLAFGPVLRGALVGELDVYPGIEEGLLPQALLQHVILVNRGLLKDFRVRLEAHHGATGAALWGGAAVFQLCHGLAPLEPLEVQGALRDHLHLQPGGQGVHHRGAHAVQAARNLVAAPAELAARVEDGEHHGHGGQARLVLHPHRDAPAVVRDIDHVPRQQAHVNRIAEARQGLVDGVVHNLVHQVVQAPRAGGADIHAGPLAHRLQALQDLDLVAVISFFDLCHVRHFVDIQAKTLLKGTRRLPRGQGAEHPAPRGKWGFLNSVSHLTHRKYSILV